MNLTDMRFIKLNRNKTPREKLDLTYDYNIVEYYADLGVMVQEPFVVFDVDDNTQFLKLKDIIESKNIKCNMMKTNRGGHFWFKSPKVLSNNVKIQTPIGIEIDVRSYGKKSYTQVKESGSMREWVGEVYPFDMLDNVPFWLEPIDHKYKIVDLKDGEGRNDTLYSYIIVLNQYMSRDRVRETFRIINEYILADKLDYKELETILRDESFENLRPSFFDKSRFMFDKFSKWLTTNYSIMRRESLLYLYKDNHYVNDDSEIERLMLSAIPNLNRNQRREVLDYLSLLSPEVPPVSMYHILTKNCIVDVRDRSQHEFSQDYFIPNQLDVVYDETITEHENVDNFMNKVCENDQEIIDLMYEMIGYTLIPTSSFHKSFILYGDGSNGKSTLLDMVIAMIDSKNISSLSLKEINHNFKLAEITDKLANIGDDISDEYISDSSIFKKLVTGEEITVERKHEQPYSIRNTATLMFATNNLPDMADKSSGMIRRLSVVPFNAWITREDPDFDPFIIDKLTTDEAKSYLLNRALEGLERVFYNQGFTEPRVVKELMDDYYREINNVLQFMDIRDKGSIVGKISNDVYNDYVFWCIEANQVPYKLRRFNTEIRKATNLVLRQRRKNGDVVQVWVNRDDA